MATALPDTYPLISAAELKSLLAASKDPAGAVAVLDCRFELADPGKGPADFARQHVPGARYVHIDIDLCAEKTGTNGRHPLPDFFDFVQRTQQWGLKKDQLIVAMDANRHMVSGRLWWMLRWAGYRNAKVLNGGWQAWLASGGATEGDAAAPPSLLEPAAASSVPADPVRTESPQMATVDVQGVLQNLAQPAFQLLDGRDAERFEGRYDNMDPVAGHIPGAQNRAWTDNLTEAGEFKPADQLRAEFKALLGGRDPREIVHSCGSGVTACNNLLAMEAAGLSGSKLYPGSWSEYCADPTRPIERGPASQG